MKFIELKNSNRMAIVDELFYDHLNQFEWYENKPDGKTAYARATIFGERVFMHRHIAGLLGWVAPVIDHINRQGLDNRQENLRPATAAQNCWNSGRKRGASGHRGVSKSGNGWVVKLTVNKQMRYFGFFSDLDEAKRVADAAAHQLRGEFDSEPKRAA